MDESWRGSMFVCGHQMSGSDRQAGDNMERKLDFTREQQDENANVI